MSSDYGWDAPPGGRDTDSNPRSGRSGGNGREDGGRLADARADDAYGYGSDGYGGQDGYDQGYDGYGNGGGYNGNGFAEDGAGSAGYDNGQYGDDGYNSYGGNGQDQYASRDAYATGDIYGAPDAYAGADPWASGPHAMTDSYGNGGDAYGSGAGGYGDGYGSDAGYGGQDGYGQDAFGGQDSYGSPAGAGYERGGGYDEPDYGWRDSRPQGVVDDPGLTRRRPAADDAFDADDARHDGFFRGFGASDDDFPVSRGARGGGSRGGGGRGRGGRPARKRGGSRAGLVALMVVVVVIAGIAGVGFHYYSVYKARHATFSGSGFGSTTILVKSGDTFDSIASQLLSKHVIAAIDPWASFVANKQGLHPGKYKIHIHMSPAATYAALINQKNLLNSKVTIVDGLRLTKILPALAFQSGIPLSQFQAAAKNTAALGLPPYANGQLEGFLYPDTYSVAPGESALQILKTAVTEFKTKVAPLHLQASAQTVGYTARDIIIGASLLEGEVGPKYFGDVARVIDNRLNASPKINLGLDSTIAYALNKSAAQLTNSDLQVNSPYNTRTHAGLPPGPIDSPDIQAIEAFLHPPHNSFLYFITVDKKGTTMFTADFNQFLAWQQLAKKNGVI